MKRQETDQLLGKARALTEDILKMEAIDTDQAFRRVQQRLKKVRRQMAVNQLIRLAACLSLPLLISTLVLGYHVLAEWQVPGSYAEVKAAPGSVIRYELPDQSIVWLNAETTLRYPTTFQTGRREVFLQGEAFFEVQASPDRPFYVNTWHGPTVYVYGTQFNITAYAEDAAVSTVLAKGKVNVQLPNDEEAVLHPGEQLIYDKSNGHWSRQTVDVYEKVAWKDGTLVFRNATLPEIFQKLSRHFHVEIEWKSRKPQQNRYRATFRKETLPQIMEYLTQSADMKWRTVKPARQEDGSWSPARIEVEIYE